MNTINAVRNGNWRQRWRRRRTRTSADSTTTPAIQKKMNSPEKCIPSAFAPKIRYPTDFPREKREARGARADLLPGRLGAETGQNGEDHVVVVTLEVCF